MMFLKCDADGCNHREDCEDYGPNLIDKPCPECGANLLTKEDFEGAEPMRLLMEEMRGVGLLGEAKDMESPVLVEFGHHEGRTVIKLSAPSEQDQ